MSSSAISQPPAVRESAIAAVLADRLVFPRFQPIVDLGSGAVVGVEALARGPAGSLVEFPDRLFAAAAEVGRLGELDQLCAERALERAVRAAVPPPLLFVNAEPAVLDQPLSPRLIELVAHGLPFRQVLEFTERALPAVPGSLLRIAGLVEQWGNAIALDDVGVDPMSLAMLPVLEPAVIKLDMSLLRAPHTEHTRTVCRIVQAAAQHTAAIVIAEGIETEQDADTARALGARWGQGWLFGRPAGIEHAAPRYDAAAAAALRAPRPGFHQGGSHAVEQVLFTAAAPGTDRDVAAAIGAFRDAAGADDAAVVIVSDPAAAVAGTAVAVAELLGQAPSALVTSTVIPHTFVAVLLGPGYGQALCIRSTGAPRVATTRHVSTVAALARVLLNHAR